MKSRPANPQAGARPGRAPAAQARFPGRTRTGDHPAADRRRADRDTPPSSTGRHQLIILDITPARCASPSPASGYSQWHYEPAACRSHQRGQPHRDHHPHPGSAAHRRHHPRRGRLPGVPAQGDRGAVPARPGPDRRPEGV